MKKIKLASGLALPPDAVTQTFGIMARKGAGKTYCAQKLAEGMLEAGAQIVVLDPIGNWWSLRLAANGTDPAFEIPVFGGLRGDVPLQSTAGELVADVIADTGTSAVLDLSQFRKGERKRFVADFGERLFMRRKREPSPTHVFLEEAQAFVPQRVGKDETRMAGAIEDIVRMGRNYGLGATMISQRPQSVNKEVLNQVEVLVVLQINGAHERKAIEQWITYQGVDVDDMVRQLPSLAVGEAFIWSPQWLDLLKRVRISKKSTFDASKTPSLGKRKKERKLGPVDLAQITERMSAVVEEQKANDPRELKREVARLQKALSERGVAAPDEIRELQHEIQSLRGALFKLRLRALDHVGACEPLLDSLSAAARDIWPADSAAITRPQKRPPTSEPVAMAANDAVLGTNAHDRILQVLLQHPKGLAPTKARYLARISARSSTMGVALAELRKEGLAERGLPLRPTPRAVSEYGGKVPPLPTGEQLRAYWIGVVGSQSAAGRILSELCRVWPQGLDDDEICERVGISRTASTLGVAKADLRKLELIDKARGSTKALDHLFEEP